MPLRESGEMYLETILILTMRKASIRAIDIVDEMGFSKPSVSRAMKKLKEQQYILVNNDGLISLTDSGKAIAEKIYERHTVLTETLLRLGVDQETASTDACKIEHIISDKTFSVIKKYMETYDG